MSKESRRNRRAHSLRKARMKLHFGVRLYLNTQIIVTALKSTGERLPENSKSTIKDMRLIKILKAVVTILLTCLDVGTILKRLITFIYTWVRSRKKGISKTV